MLSARGEKTCPSDRGVAIPILYVASGKLEKPRGIAAYVPRMASERVWYSVDGSNLFIPVFTGIAIFLCFSELWMPLAREEKITPLASFGNFV